MNKHTHTAALLAAMLAVCAVAQPVDAADKTAIVASPLAPLAATDEVGPIVLAKMPVLQVLDLLRTYSGRVIIPAADLPTPVLSFKSANALRRDEAILIIETLLRLNGIMLVKQDEQFIQAVPHAQVLRYGPTVLEDGEPGDPFLQQVYGRIFELQFLNSKTMSKQVRGMLSAGQPDSILNLEWRNALLIFDTAHNLDSLAKVIEMLDQPAQHRAEVFIIPVKHSTVHSVYNALVHAQRYRANSALFNAHIHIDAAANHLVAVAPPESKTYIEDLVGRLDQEIAPLTTSQVFKIRKGNIRTIHAILSGIVRHQQTWFTRQGFRSPETYRTSQALPGAPDDSAEGEAPEAEAAPQPSVNTVVSDLADASAELQFSPYMGIWIDHQNNALVAYGTPADMRRATALIEQLDQESAPYTVSEVIPLKHAYAPGIGGLLNHMVQVQRASFARQGQTSGETRTGQSDTVSSAQNPEQAFEFSPYMYIWTERASNSVLIYGTRGDIERIKAIIQKLDVEQAPVTRSKTVQIKNTQATTVASMISRIIQLQQIAFSRQGVYTGETREGATPAEANNMETGFEFTPYALVTADRTGNSLFIYGTARDIQRVEELLADLDRKAAPITRSKVYYLKHADADSLSRIISQVIFSQRRIFQQRGLRTDEEGAAHNVRQQTEITMGFEFTDFATVVADRRSNSILIYGADSDISRVDDIIKETDIPVEPVTGSKVFALKHADANALSRVLQIIVSSQRRALRDVESAGEKVRNPDKAKDTSNQAAVEGIPAVQFSPFLSIVPDARNNALIVYGTHADLEHVADLVKQTDVEVAPVTRSEVFFLENARARVLASILSRMISSQQSAMRLVQSRFLAVHYPGKDEDPSLATAMMYDPSEPMQFSPYVSVVANDRNNSLLVYGTDEDIGQLRKIVEQNDVEVAPRTQSRIFYIKHADANDVLRTINPLITSQQRVRERESTLRRFFRRNSGRDDEAGAPDAAAGSGASAPADAAPAPEDFGADMAGVGLDYDEDLQFSPYVTLSADDRSNSIIVYGTPFDLEQVGTLIEDIDRVLPQVQIEVVIAEVMLKKGQVSGLSSFGVSYDNPFPVQVESGKNGGVIGRGGVIASGPASLEGNGSSVDLNMSLDPFSLQTVFRVAKEDSSVRVLSAPTITTSHNRPASINVGEARPIITSSSSSLNSANLVTRSEVEYRDIGIQLNVRPLVSEEGYIQLEIDQTVETVIDTQTIDNNEQPIIGTRRANSFVSVRDKQILVMGGLQSEDTIVSEGKVWLLGDIPLLGRLFRPKRNTSTVRELIIFIRPKLVEGMDTEDFISRGSAGSGAVAGDVATYLKTGRFPGQLAAEGVSATNTADRVEEGGHAK